MPSQIDEIKARIDIVDLISEYVRLKQMGANWKALCPFHNEKTPSFMVSREKQIWHCFGCSAGGDIFSFIQKIEGLEFAEALRLLAKKAGVTLEHRDPVLATQRNQLLDICSLAANFWHQTLLESPQAQKVRDYLKKRQVNEQTIADFKLGYAQDCWDSLIKFLKSRGFSDNEIFLAGLSVKKERGQDFYDRFRDRLIFPINDIHSNPVGFSGRTLKETSDKGQETSDMSHVTNEHVAKYINTPQTLIYNKSLILFNLDKAKLEIKKQNLIIVVEGQMDALASAQAGVENVVAVSGTALTADQIRILKRYTNNIAIAFDTDVAGQTASRRGIDLALGEDLNVKIIILPYGKDPDECIQNNPTDWSRAIKEAKSIMDYYFTQVQSRLDLTQVEGKKEAAKILLAVISKIGNKIEKAHWLQKLGELLGVSEQILRESISAQKSAEKITTAAQTGITRQRLEVVKDRNIMLSERILAIVLKYPEHLPYLIDNLTPAMVIPDQLSQLYKELIIYYTKDINGSINDFKYSQFQEKIKPLNLNQLVDTLGLLAEKDFFDFFEEGLIKNEVIKVVNALKKNYFSAQLKELEIKIKKAEQEKKLGEIEILSRQFSEIISQINLLELE